MKSLILMIQFFTRIPIKINFDIVDEDFSKGIVYMPFVGLIIGLFNLGIYYSSAFIKPGYGTSHVSCIKYNNNRRHTFRQSCRHM